MVSRILAILAVALATCYANQESCACQPQPTIIQLSCGNGGNNGVPSHPPPPPPPPMHEYTTTAPYGHGGHPEATTAYYPEESGSGSGSNEWNLQHDMDRMYCAFDFHGYPLEEHLVQKYLPLPAGFRVNWQTGTAVVPYGYPEPSPYWDGYPSTLGFPMPAKGTELYNMLLCYPYRM